MVGAAEMSRDLGTGEVSRLGGRTGRRALSLGGWEEDKVDDRVGQPGHL